jgi:hypothetical protein
LALQHLEDSLNMLAPARQQIVILHDPAIADRQLSDRSFTCWNKAPRASLGAATASDYDTWLDIEPRREIATRIRKCGTADLHVRIVF